MTKREMIRTVLTRFRAQYDKYGWNERQRAVETRLMALDLETCHEDAITAAIGNACWTGIPCAGCGGLMGEVVNLRLIDLCRACVCSACVQLGLITSVS